IQHEILQRAVQEVWIRLDKTQVLSEHQLGGDGRPAHGMELWLEELDNIPHCLIDVYWLPFRRRHFGEFGETTDNGVELHEFGTKGFGGLAKNFVELLRRFPPGTLEILDGELEREQRVLQLMRQPPRHFTPGGNALGLEQVLALLGELLRHL